ncbi:Gfo/Idh/MocA family protein [Singulisphaera acidiphila]|uniref:Putative dehydrogenase n=1 Tax=Singulisphaera acidiphila (strain ATCC BAA-1392 / DSM 18658 / VKM B-2454 / MOB10) TaxID=886293 RepID=L0D548_SINAD|nr:Gfo/Idh/MocA family oxidoreductase [Singulisphaera acidiphila]AGA24564.1 putative dehydrogenase [Singulisphaera acidiphila DSM 18658]
MSKPDQPSRRSFLKSAAVASAAPAVATTKLSQNVYALNRDQEPARPAGPNDRIRIATIGMGIIGFIDTDTALKVPGVELVAVSDLYEGRRVHAKEVYGDKVETFLDYREILARKDVDAVLVCVPDHWHAQISIDAMKAGKAVYCEKPMVRIVDEGPQVIDVQKQTGAVFQVGSQYASSLLYDKVKDLIKKGAIGEINTVEARYNRNSDTGAWQYSIPTDASPETVDWDRFLGTAPKLPFDPVRFFRWRNYWDYGTAVAGDLFVHLLTGIHHATGSLGPNRIAGMGGLRYWKDGRDVYDVIMGLLDYPQTDVHPGFTLSLQTNFADGGGGDTYFRFVGSEGVINVSFTSLTVSGPGIQTATADQVLKGYNSVRTFSNAQQKAFAEKFLAEEAAKGKPKPRASTPEKFVVPNGYDERFDHFVNFFNSVRDKKPVYEDAVFGYRAAAPALLCNDSYRQGRVIGWDPANLKVTS